MRHQSSYIPTLDGWRAFSVLGVILYHGRSSFFHKGSLAVKLASRGDIGVSVFFAISGFLICGLLLKEFAREGDISLRRFYVRRLFRILPPYSAALLAIGLLAVFGVIRVNHWELPSCLLFYRNYKPLGLDESGGFYTAHFWSLALEEHFYMFWPLLLILVRPKRAGTTAFVLALAIFNWRILDGHFHLLATVLPQTNESLRTDTRADALLWGCLAAIYFPRIKQLTERIRFSQLWLLIVTVLVVVETLHVPGLLTWRTILLPALILSTVLQPQSVLGQVLEWRPFRWLGTLSYSLYLWQELFLPQLPSEAARGSFHVLQQWPWNVVAIFATASLSRYLLEIPMTRLGHRLSGSLDPWPQLNELWPRLARHPKAASS